MKDKEHPFYRKSKKWQSRQLLKFVGIAVLILVLLVIVSLITGWFFLVFLGIALLLSVLAPFIDTPQGKKSGKLIYYSPLFITEKEKNGRIIIHGGTLFDYYYHFIYGEFPTTKRRRFVLQQYALGLLNLLESFEGENDDFQLKGTSYFLNKSTAQKLGFQIEKTDFLQRLILLYNFLPVMFSYSIVKGKPSIPPLLKTKTFTASLAAISTNKAYLKRLATT